MFEGNSSMTVFLIYLTCRNYKACFSVVGTKKIVDFPVTFEDMQRLHLLRQKVARILDVLKSFHSIICSLQAHGTRLNEAGVGSVSLENLQELEMCQDQALTYIRRIEWISSFSDGISSLVSSLPVDAMATTNRP